MALSSQPGSSQSQPGGIQPGYFCTGVAVWTGPYPRPEVLGGSLSGDQVNVTPTIASSMAVSDQTWWVFH